MTMPESPRFSWLKLVVAIARSSVGSMYQNWALASFSLVAAFAIWFIVEDVENPRVTLRFPAEGLPAAIPVEARNAGDLIMKDSFAVAVVLEGRDDDLENLVPGDFRAYVDVQDMQPGIEDVREVKVESRRNGVSVIEVIPSAVRVTVVEPEERELPVTIRRSGQVAAGYQEVESAATAEPATVIISGLPERVASVRSVDLDVNLSGVRDNTTIEGDLVARSQSGAQVVVTITPARARATLQIEQTFVQRTLPVEVLTTGDVASGYMITNVKVEPATVAVTGPQAVVSGLTKLTTPALDVSGARTDQTLIRTIDEPQNTSLGRPSVTVTVEIRPIQCSTGPEGAPCGGTTFVVAPTFEGAPTGLTHTGFYSVEVKVTGPLTQLRDLKPGDIKATVSLAGGATGTRGYPVTVSVPSGLKAEPVPNLQVTLIALTSGGGQ
jgi:YbbR domain-containing protein